MTGVSSDVQHDESASQTPLRWAHPLWCDEDLYDDAEHRSHGAWWDVTSDDVRLGVQFVRLDENVHGQQERGDAKILLTTYQTASVNADLSPIVATVHLDAREARLLIRFLQDHVDRLGHPIVQWDGVR